MYFFRLFFSSFRKVYTFCRIARVLCVCEANWTAERGPKSYGIRVRVCAFVYVQAHVECPVLISADKYLRIHACVRVCARVAYCWSIDVCFGPHEKDITRQDFRLYFFPYCSFIYIYRVEYGAVFATQYAACYVGGSAM